MKVVGQYEQAEETIRVVAVCCQGTANYTREEDRDSFGGDVRAKENEGEEKGE